MTFEEWLHKPAHVIVGLEIGGSRTIQQTFSPSAIDAMRDAWNVAYADALAVAQPVMTNVVQALTGAAMQGQELLELLTKLREMQQQGMKEEKP